MVQANTKDLAILIDFEATSVDPKSARPIEICMMLVDENFTNVHQRSYLLYLEGQYPEISKEVEELTSITNKMVQTEGISLVDALTKFGKEIDEHLVNVKNFIAYNSEYDETLMHFESTRQPIGLTKLGALMLQTKWLCAMKDVEANYKHKCWKLSHLALEHGLMVDPAGLHRAAADVFLMRRMLEKLSLTPLSIKTFQDIPWVIMQALIPAPFQDGGKGRDLAVARGYSWERPRGSQEKYEKCWVRKVKQHLVEDEILSAPFKLRVLSL